MPAPDADPVTGRMPDGGPIYVETVDLSAAVVEPWNAASAALFVVIAVAWLVRLRGRYAAHPFVAVCLPILLAGGVGGTLYHATRASRAYFLLDVVPISILAVLAGVYLWVRLSGRNWLPLCALLVVSVAVEVLGFSLLPAHWAINLSYATLALIVIVPAVVMLVRTRFQAVGWFGTALVCFGVALFFRAIDVLRPPVLPMGTHWLWHTFGAATTAALTEYFYRLPAGPLTPATRPSSPELA